jgi:hypothetical protein
MKIVRFTASACIALALSSCQAPKPQECLLGKWEDKDHYLLEFRKDGTVVGQLRAGMYLVPVDGKYRFVDEETLQIDSTSTVYPKALASFKINRLEMRELCMTSANGIMTIWTRPPPGTAAAK